MAIMTFLEELEDFLNEHKEIYSVRRFLYEANIRVVYIPDVGGCKRELIGEVKSAAELMPYYSKSGFDSVVAWWSKIKEINRNHMGNGDKLYLYHIEKIR